MAAIQRYSDGEIYSAARRALDEHPAVPHEVRLHVQYGTVTLTGSVLWAHEKSHAEEVVRRVNGVLRVVNNIDVAHIANPKGFGGRDRRSAGEV